ncbi:DUF4339 domain-containing protein [Bombella saccharophila]|uniref:DUF4339 domain-containing protein n=1 Tax=Bombella saccharophila TaxID=2967338 RepID=A0ABT3W9L6_9PROT|nr:DUF4339 domain-containing protein [Bombella saccharophila]MCX5615079.1 DUF4339 domain-containing protein [Bombella saccharophila]PHI96237.1 hypothetical protein BG621_04545 [Parasaccharibacter apium]
MQWYYERDGQQVGPVSQAEMVRLAIHHDIKPQTLVWHPAFGNEWRPASKAGLAFPSGDVKIFTLTLGQPKPATAVAAGTGGKLGKVPFLWAWMLLLPEVVNVTLLFAGQILHWTVHSESLLTGLCIGAILFLAFMQDRKALTLAGVTPPAFLWLLFIPGYLWCRWRIVRKGFILFVCSAFLMVGEGAILITNPPPGFPHVSFQVQSVKSSAEHSTTGQKSASSSPDNTGPAQAAPQEGDVQL